MPIKSGGPESWPPSDSNPTPPMKPPCAAEFVPFLLRPLKLGLGLATPFALLGFGEFHPKTPPSSQVLTMPSGLALGHSCVSQLPLLHGTPSVSLPTRHPGPSLLCTPLPPRNSVSDCQCLPKFIS
jgi:hypothetical protein